MTTHPAVGAFLRPVGNFLYCLRVTEVRTGNAHGLSHIETERWGMEQKSPCATGTNTAAGRETCAQCCQVSGAKRGTAATGHQGVSRFTTA